MFGEYEYDSYECMDDYGDEVFKEAYVYLDNETKTVRHDYTVEEPK